MRRMNASDFLRYTEEQLWELPLEDIVLVCADGEIETTMEETIYSSYSWNIHKAYPLLPFLKNHHMNGRVLSKRTHLILSNAAVWDCVDLYNANGIEVLPETLAKLAYETFIGLYNAIGDYCEAYVTSLSAIDIVEVITHPDVQAAMLKLMESGPRSHYTTEVCNAEIKKILLDDTKLPDNGLAKIIRIGTVKDEQILQMVGARGGVTDYDSTVFPHVIKHGFGTGLNELWESMQESRSATKSLLFTGDPMEKSEYSNRSIQLSASTLARLHHVDCGSRDYLPVTLNSFEVEARKKMLYDFAGMIYLDPDTNKEKVFWPTDTHLLGKTIPFRTVFTCRHQDREGICVRCFGMVGQSVARYTNIGYLSTAQLQGKITQLLMSNKHLDSNAKAEQLSISEYDKVFLRLGAQEQHIYLNPELGLQKYKLVIAHEEAPHLSDIFTVRSAKQLVPDRMSSLSYVLFELENSNDKPIVEVRQGQRNAALTMEALLYLRRKNWTRNEQGHYVVDMSEWNYNHPLVALPLKHFSSMDYMLDINSFIRGGSSGRNGTSIMSYSEPIAALMAFHDLVSKKLTVNVSHLQTILLSTMVQDREARDYRLPLPRTSGQFARYHEIMFYRSPAAGMAFQNQAKLIFSASSYLVDHRPRHPLDWMWTGGR